MSIKNVAINNIKNTLNGYRLHEFEGKPAGPYEIEIKKNINEIDIYTLKRIFELFE